MSKATVAIVVALTFADLAAPAAPAPTIERFRITITSRSARVQATGALVRGLGTAMPTGGGTYAFRLPGGAGSLTETITARVRSMTPGCVEQLTQRGSFTFHFAPTARPGFSYRGRGGFRAISITARRRLPRGGCDRAAPATTRLVTLDAAATEFVGVG